MKIYLLQARGPNKMWNSMGTPSSRTAFRSSARADAAKLKFIETCLTSLHEDDWGVLSRVDRVDVLEVELEDA